MTIEIKQMFSILAGVALLVIAWGVADVLLAYAESIRENTRMQKRKKAATVQHH